MNTFFTNELRNVIIESTKHLDRTVPIALPIYTEIVKAKLKQLEFPGWNQIDGAAVSFIVHSLGRELGSKAPVHIKRGRSGGVFLGYVERAKDTASPRPNIPPASALKTLGLTWPCTFDEANKMYKQLAFSHHPDRGGSQAKFVEIQNAFNVLKKYLR